MRNDVTITAGTELVILQILSQLLMVINLSINLQNNITLSASRKIKKVISSKWMKIMKRTVTTMVLSSLKRGWSPESGSTIARRSWAK